jgi:hypothetical protein
MKLKNVVEGMVIEAKHKAYGLSHEVIPKGLQVLVHTNDGSSIYGVCVTHEDIEDGYAWVNPTDFRKVIEVAVEEVPEAPTEHVYKVGDEVLVGSEGAGYGYVDRDLANKVCTVTAVHADGCLRVAYPLVTTPRGYLTYPHYVSPYVEPEPVKEFQEGVIVRITRTHKARHGEQVQAGDTCEVSHKFQLAPDMYTLKHPNGGFGQLTIHQDDLELVEEPTKLHDFREGDVLLCTDACTGKHYEQCVEGRLYTYIAKSGHVGRVRVGDPALYLEEAAVLPENFTLYARKVEDDAAL